MPDITMVTSTTADSVDAHDKIFAALRRIEEATQIILETAGEMGTSAGAREHSGRLEFCAETIFADIERADTGLKLIPMS